jgi:hypothetical protein
MRTITSNPKQQRHIEILTRLEAGVLEVGTAAELLGVGARQVRRLRVMLGWQAVRLPSSRLSRFVHCPIRRSRGILTMSGDPGPSLTTARQHPISCDARREGIPTDGVTRNVGSKCSPAERLGEYCSSSGLDWWAQAVSRAAGRLWANSRASSRRGFGGRLAGGVDGAMRPRLKRYPPWRRRAASCPTTPQGPQARCLPRAPAGSPGGRAGTGGR